MNDTALFWLIVNGVTLVIMAYYSMVEMAAVSFNKVRLQYYVSQGNQRAIWLDYLMQKPTRLFGTTLIGVNVTMMIGSEAAREFYGAIGLSKDLAPITQVLIVIIIGELAPMFAARRYPEKVTMLGIPILFASAKLMQPFIWMISGLTSLVSLIVDRNKKEKSELFLSRDDLQNLLQEEEMQESEESSDFNRIVSNLFVLRNKQAYHIMDPMKWIKTIPSNCTVGHVRRFLRGSSQNFLPIFHKGRNDIISIVFPRDLIQAEDQAIALNYSKAPWFISRTTKLIDILSQFRQNKRTVAIVLNDEGKAEGMITLDAVLEEVFGKTKEELYLTKSHQTLIEKTISASTTLKAFEQEFSINLKGNPEWTLSQMLNHHLKHPPEEGEVFQTKECDLIVKEASLMEAKLITVKTKAK